MIHCLDGLSGGILVLVRRLLSNKLFARFRVLSLAELSKTLSGNRTGNAGPCSETALPLASDHTPL
jgi:hypothetical protein